MGFKGQPIGSSVNIYNSDGLITDATRNVQIGTTLNFLHGLAGVNGYFQMTSGGYFRAQTSISTNYLEYSNVNGVLLMTTDTHTVTGLRAENGGGVGNPTALVELFAGSNGTAYLNTGATTGIFYILNNGGVNTVIYTSSGAWGISGLPEHTVGLNVYGKGGTSATFSQKWRNSSGTIRMAINDAGVLGIGVNAESERFAEYDSANGNYIIGNAARGAVMPGTFVSIPIELRYNYSRSGATGDTGHTLGLFNLSSRALANASAGSAHHIFDIIGATHNDNPIVSIRENGNIIQQLFRDGKMSHVGLPTYADEAAAIVGGLPTNHFYKTATGELRIKL